MHCTDCGREIADASNFCYFCGGRQPAGSAASAAPRRERRLRRSATDRKLGGVCAGLAEYMDADPTVVRLVWILLVVFPIPFVPAVLGYLVAWLVIPSAMEPAPVPAGQKRLVRSRTDRQFAGVCGGIGQYLGLDSTVVRVVWAVLGVVPGAIIGGLIAYFIAWIVMPEEPVPMQVAAHQHG